MLAARLIELGNADRVVAMKFPAYYVRHESKVLWLLHQFRQAYELWGTPYQDLPSTPEGERVRQAIADADNRFLREPERVYTNSKIVGERLRSANGIESEVLYPPLGDSDGFRCDSYGDFVFYPSRLTEGKRQHLLVEAMAHVRGNARLVLAGSPDNPEYLERLEETIERAGVGDRVELRSDWISEQDKRDLYANALASAYTPYDEDSYGYVSLESFHSRKPVLTCTDSGGTLELIQDGVNGRVLPPEPQAIAQAIDELHADKKRAAAMGEAGYQRLTEMQINWDTVIEKLTRMRIAWFTPFSLRSAIGEYSKHVTDELARRCEVAVWSADEEESRPTDLRQVDFARNPEALAELPDYDLAVYNLGDHAEYHGQIYEVARTRPGLVILHDRTYQNLFASHWFSRRESNRYVERMEAFYGPEGRDVARDAVEGRRPKVWSSDDESLRFPLFEEALTGALGAVTHSVGHAETVRRRWFGPVRPLEFPSYARMPEAPTADRDPGEEDRVTLLTLGYVNRNKRIDRVVDVLARNPDLAQRVRYLVVGPHNPASPYLAELQALVRNRGVEGSVQLLGYQPDETVDRLLAGADVFVNLRYPSLESASASLVEQLGYGRPIVVYDTGSFAELSDDVVAKVPTDDPKALEATLRRLVDDPEARRGIGAAAREEAERRSVGRFADGFLGFVEEVRAWRPRVELCNRVATELAGMAVDPGLPAVDAVSRALDAIIGGRSAAESVELREVGPADADALARFFERNDHPDVVAGFDPFPLTGEVARKIALEPRRDRFYATVLDGRVVAMSMLRGWDEGFDVPSFGIVVDRRHHGQGLGSQLTDFTIAEAARLGTERVRLSVYGDNPVARGMYESRGFEVTSQDPVTHDGRSTERLVMVKELGSGR